MTVYLIHLDEPLPCGVGRNGKPKYSSHYLGFAEDLVGRLLEHKETTWEPFDEPVVLESGEKVTGVKHGPGAVFMVGKSASRARAASGMATSSRQDMARRENRALRIGPPCVSA